MVLVFEQNTRQGWRVFLFKKAGGGNMREGALLLPEFSSLYRFREPDVRQYQQQKGVEQIKQENDLFTDPINGCDCVFTSHRIGTVLVAPRSQCLTRFPGHSLPGPGGNCQINTGALEWNRFQELAKFAGIPVLGDCQLVSTVAEPKLPSWDWLGVAEPDIFVLSPIIVQTLPWGEAEWQMYVEGLRHSLRQVHNCSMAKILSLARQAWDQHGKMIYDSDALLWAEKIMCVVGKENCDLNAIFELEAAVSCRQYSRDLRIHSRGVYRGMWIEVGEVGLASIKATELVMPVRIIQELQSLYKNGFAPIVVNEYGCNTDGSHRHTTAWLWNLLKAIGSFNSGVLQSRVTEFVVKHCLAMGPIITREVLRVLSELLANHRQLLFEEIMPQVQRYNPIATLPVILLNEYSAGTVVKKEYDEGTAVRRVDPETYRLLANNPSFTLPARGPYHRTDRSILPWFQILEKE
ncbi:MAG: hypothetical protein US42_C0008G0084 [Candidatus Magasanikbacteria bacterium GW2011_GWC2_37_14]|uniref:Uncharacterized protein n=1 Tax=Candidatus Magasanikbacteria bacterium GW2011_GWC2_37_14 TaxID=1619046 RepID=A0A0G0G8Z6_9BACT|nr:MAG: hypothetical protein US42_C0008G0084 [Candidatus Magasanikbacteria bacterium GW2011_GWC2_37_14]